MTKKKTLINERVARRWGKLANMTPLMENWLDEQDDELEGEIAGAEDEMAAGEAEAEVEVEAEPEASAEEEEAVERIVAAVVDAIASETGVAIEVEGEAGDGEAEMEAGMEVEDDLDAEAAGLEGAEMDLEDEAANRRPAYNRKDVNEEFGGKKDDRKKGGADKDDSQESEDTADYEDPTSKKGKARRESALGEKLDLDVVDDEDLTEAVLKRVVERLLRANRK